MLKRLTCDMEKDCQEAVSHIDCKGFIYCEEHGKRRKLYMSCRKLTKKELTQLESGKPLGRY